MMLLGLPTNDESAVTIGTGTTPEGMGTVNTSVRRPTVAE